MVFERPILTALSQNERRLLLRERRVLSVPQAAVEGVEGEQVVVGTAFDDAALREHENLVHALG